MPATPSLLPVCSFGVSGLVGKQNLPSFGASTYRSARLGAGDDEGGRGFGQEVTYRPFGEAVEFVTDPAALPETKGFIGERFDADAGLQYLNARYYDPKLGMFIQPDWFEVTKAGSGRTGMRIQGMIR